MLNWPIRWGRAIRTSGHYYIALSVGFLGMIIVVAALIAALFLLPAPVPTPTQEVLDAVWIGFIEDTTRGALDPRPDAKPLCADMQRIAEGGSPRRGRVWPSRTVAQRYVQELCTTTQP